MDPKEHGHETWADLWKEIRADETARKAREEYGEMLKQKSQAPTPRQGKERGIER